MAARLRLLILGTLLVVALAAPGSAHAAPVACPDTFTVEHNDHIGKLRLARGPYVITIANQSKLSCADAQDLFRQFLEDFDGRLFKPWTVNAATRTFTRGKSGTAFTVTAVGGGGGGGGNVSSRNCPGTFSVMHKDRIGKLRLPKGAYDITLLAVGRLSCTKAARYFTRFLQDYDGRLPRPWKLDVETGTFQRGGRNVGFRVKPNGNPPDPTPGGGGGSGRHPATGAAICPGSFRVLNRDHIGRLVVPKARYQVTALGKLSCRQASARFRAFLNITSGRLPRPWIVSTPTGTFRRGKKSQTAFRIKILR
jgi:hypothetical protein